MRIFSPVLATCFFAYSSAFGAHSVDVIIFSKDRPLQLYALLESIESYVTGFEKISVIYHVRDDQFGRAYQKVKERFSHVNFINQSRAHPRNDFKELIMRTLAEPQASYVVFAVDDIIVTDHVNLLDCAQWLEKTGAYGFYLRLGKDITESYMEGRITGLPAFEVIADDVYQWQFSSGLGDWKYPNSVDMTVMKKSSVQKDFQRLSFVSPNTLEGAWAAKADFKCKGLCYGRSKMINIPLNLVQLDWGNRCMGKYSAKELLALFEQGYKIDIKETFQLVHSAPHVVHEPVFVAR